MNFTAMIRRFPFPLLLLLAVVAPGLTLPSFAAPGESAAAPLAPGWQLADPAGQPISSEQFKGKVVLLNFWATWCPPCRREIPGLIKLQQAYADRGLVVVGVSFDYKSPKKVAPFMKKYGINYPVAMGDNTIAENYGGGSSLALPTTFIIDRDGRMVASHRGYASYEEFASALAPYL